VAEPAVADAKPDPAPRTVRVSTGWSLPKADPAGPDVSGGAPPTCLLGAEAPGGLTLPNAHPTASHVYAPRAVWLDDNHLIAADTGNHRVMIWSDPSGLVDHQDASVVLGQPDVTTEGAQAAGRGSENGMHLPTGLLVHEGRLLVADAWNHRLLIWDEVPTVSDRAPDIVVGQPDRHSVEENRGGACSDIGFYWPFGVAMIDGWLWVADTGNRRVLVFDGLPEPDQPPLFVLGQDDGTARDENRGRLDADSFRWPHDIAAHNGRVYVADAGNHRVLGWDRPNDDGPADMVLGQPDFETAIEIPYSPQSAATLRFPYAIAVDDGAMAVADTANNRVLVWDDAPDVSHTPADRVLGQHDFASIGENRWDLVGSDTLCWPYGLAMHDGRLAIADSGNNRIVVWDL
jgi:hypothetical protein